MVNPRWIWLLLATALLVSCASSIAQDPAADDAAVADDEMTWTDEPIWPVKRGVEPEADRLLRAMSEYIAAADAFTVTTEVAEDVVLDHGQTVSYGRESHIAVQRPGSIHARSSGEERDAQIVIHDGRCTLFNISTDVYAITDVPHVLGDAIDTIVERYGLNVPLADIVYEDPYAAFIPAVEYGYVVGTTKIAGVECHHLAFAQETIDWQVWIETGPHPLLRKIVITYKDEPGSPNYTAHLRDWNLAPRLSKHHFVFVPPVGADQAELLPIEEADDTTAMEDGS
jgi:hypothetical protein